MDAPDRHGRLPPAIWLAGRGDASAARLADGIERAFAAGVPLQVVVLPEGDEFPAKPCEGCLELAWLPAAPAARPPGMLGSLQRGLELLGEREPGPVFVALASRPDAASRTWRALAARAGEAGAGARPRHGGKRGHPVLLDAGARARALRLDCRRASVRELLEGAVDLDVEDRGVLAPAT